MRMFPSEETEQPQPLASPPAEDDAALQQAIDTVARRVAMRCAKDNYIAAWDEYPDISGSDWGRIEIRVEELVEELDRGQGPFEAAYKLLKARANHDVV